MNQYQQYIHKSRYARYLDKEHRRETWEETVKRYITFFQDYVEENHSAQALKAIPWDEIHSAILNMEVMPSMRCLMTAGPALARDHIAGYNCAYLPIDSPTAFDSMMYILMCGTGVGYSVERQYINKLPEVPSELAKDGSTHIIFADSKAGWCKGYRALIRSLYDGTIPTWDTSNIRGAGMRLRTFGGRASGPEPLLSLLNHTVDAFSQARGRKLTSIEAHDLCCKIADVVVCGGVRRSALLSLSNLTDERMRNAKVGEFYHRYPHRQLANNSVAYTEHPDIGVFMREWLALYGSQSGERGIFNRTAAERLLPERRDKGYAWGTNPCSEIVLRPNQFCNLSEVIIRPSDDADTLRTKVRIATIIGTIQCLLTDFKHIPSKWRTNTEYERLLGVSLTGLMDHAKFNHINPDGASLLRELRELSIRTNAIFAATLGVPQSAAITCVKPSGTVSQLTDCASGIHPRYAERYIRRVRADSKDPLAIRMAASGFEHTVDVSGQLVFSFAVSSPRGAVLRDDRTALEQLEHWKWMQENWCEHKPSITVTVREQEWMNVGAWCYDNFEILSGVSFLPHSDHVYTLAPYEEVSDEEWQRVFDATPTDFDFNSVVEDEDATTGSQELACVGNSCEL